MKGQGSDDFASYDLRMSIRKLKIRILRLNENFCVTIKLPACKMLKFTLPPNINKIKRTGKV